MNHFPFRKICALLSVLLLLLSAAPAGAQNGTDEPDAGEDPQNRPPVIRVGGSAVSAITVNMDEDGDPTPFNLQAHAHDPDNDPLTWSIIEEPAQGTAKLEGTGESRDIEYRPNENYSGADAFTIRVSDGKAAALLAVNLRIDPVNDRPGIVGQKRLNTPEETPKTISLSHLLVDDPDNDYPEDFSLTVLDGENYDLTGENQIQPIPGFLGTLTVKVRVSDGDKESDPFDLAVVVANDADNDGMDDRWELEHGLDTTLDDAEDDPDMDGFTNIEEFLCGGDPQDPGSSPSRLIPDAGPDQTVAPGAGRVALNGLNSHSAEGAVAQYQWEQIRGPAVTLSDADTPLPSFTAPDADGAGLLFRVTVKSICGLEATDTAIVNVTRSGLPPVAEAGESIIVNPGAEVILDGSASTDPDDGIIRYNWQGRGIGRTIAFEEEIGTFTAPESVGKNGLSAAFELTVADHMGLLSSDGVIVNVSDFNIPPTAILQEEILTVQEGETLSLDGKESSDPDGDLLLFKWAQRKGPPVTLSAPAGAISSFVAPSVDAEGRELIFDLRVTDDGGLQESAAVKVVVQDNGITGFPEGAIPFKTRTDAVMAISVACQGALAELKSLTPANPEDAPQELPYGRIDLKIRTFSPGATACVTLHFPEVLSEDRTWYRYAGGKWLDETDTLFFSNNRRTVTINLRDGGMMDREPRADGEIEYSFGVGAPPPAAGGGGGAGDGGCFIRTGYGR